MNQLANLKALALTIFTDWHVVPRLPVFLIALGAACAVFGAAFAEGSKAAPRSQPGTLDRVPMAFYLAKGDANACGEGCNEWIAAEGYFAPGSADRMRAFLSRQSVRNLPVYFQSPGGILSEALAIGRFLRARGMTAGVARTVPQDCAPGGTKNEACRALKHSGQTLVAEFRSVGASCNSACVYALMGAKTRLVPPGARLGVHSGAFVRFDADGRRTEGSAVSYSEQVAVARYDVQLRRYIDEMGIANGILETISGVPNDKIHFLSRNQIAAFGIDGRSFQESRWTAETPPQVPSVLKFIVEASDPNRKNFRTSVIRLACGSANKVSVTYSRTLAPDDPATAASFKAIAGKQSFAFSRKGRIAKIDVFETGASFDTRVASVDFGFFEAAADAGSIAIEESAVRSPSPARIFKISTAGLPQAIGALRRRCRGAV